MRRCGGTPARPSVCIGGTVIAKAEPGKDGCGHQVIEHPVDATEPAAPGQRPLFERTAVVVICPHCDGPET